MKIVAHCAVWLLAFCAVLISPVILIFAVPLAIGIGADIVHYGAGPVAAVAMAATLASLMLWKPPVRALVRNLIRPVPPLDGSRPAAARAPVPQTAKLTS